MQLKQGCRLWWLALVVLLADQLTKRLARGLTRVVSVIPGALSWELAHNRGAAFSMFSGKDLFLVILSALLVAVLLAWQFRRDDNALAERIG